MSAPPREPSDHRLPSAPGSERFYSDPDIASRYDRSRGLSPTTMAAWRQLIAERVSPGSTRGVVDLGCGTGRFTSLLASIYDGPLLALDASAPMLQAARRSTADTRVPVRFIRASGEALPLPDGRADLFFLSMVFHHFADPARAAGEIRRCLRPGGSLFIRTCTLEALHSYVYQRFFPAARACDERRFPPRRGLIELVGRKGFRLRAADLVHQQVASNLDDYVERVRLRSHSDLQAVSDQEFEEGLKRFEDHARREGGAASGPVLEEVEVFTFEAVS